VIMPFKQYECVEYDGHQGYIDFVDDSYITICVAVKDRHCEDTSCLHRQHRCCILVYPEAWKRVKRIENCYGPLTLVAEQPQEDAIMAK